MTPRTSRAPRWWVVPSAVALLSLLAAFLRFWNLRSIPPGFHFDEAYEALEAWRLITQPGYHPIFFPGNFGVEPAFIYLTSVAFRLFGETPLVMRGLAAVIGTLTVPALYLLVRELRAADPRIPAGAPLLSAAALAIMRWHITFSRVGIEPILIPLALVLLLWGFWRGMRTGSLAGWLVFGIVAGVGSYTYPAGRLVSVLAALLSVGALVAVRRRRGFSPNRGRPAPEVRGLVLAGLVGLVLFAPLALHWIQVPEHLLLRSRQIAVTPGGTATGSPFANIVAALGMFFVRGDIDPRSNVPDMPVLDVLMAIPFVLGTLLTLRHARRGVYASLIFAAIVMVLPTILSNYAPHFRRALGLAPLVAIACGIGLGAILSWGRRAPLDAAAQVPARVVASGIAAPDLASQIDGLRQLARAIVVAALLLGSGIYATTVYQVTWGRMPALYHAYDQGLWEIGQFVLGIPAGERVYLSPRPASDMTLAFAWREGTRPVTHFDGRLAFPAPVGAPANASPATYIIIEHEDFRGWRLLHDLYPQAEVTRTFVDRAGEVYARAYRLSPGIAPVRRPRYPAEGSWGDIGIVGYDLDRPAHRPGETIFLQLWWRAAADPGADLTVFTHLEGPPRADGSPVWAQQDGQPGQGSLRTTTWRGGEWVLDEYRLQIPLDAPPGEYRLVIGLYDAATGLRVPLQTPAGEDALVIGTATVE